MTLWALKQMNKRLDRFKPLKGDESTNPKVISNRLNQLGDLTLRFDMPMLFEEVFEGYTFSSGPTAKRNLQKVELSSVLQVDITRGSDTSAPSEKLVFDAAIQSYDSQSLTLKLTFENPLSLLRARSQID